MFYNFNRKDAEMLSDAQLARLLAIKKLNIRYSPSVKTASINLQTGEAVFPMWVGISTELRHMLIVHETGHSSYTPYEEWVAATDLIANRHHSDPRVALRAKATIVQFLNIVEDPRVDKKQKRRFPGCRHDYVVGLRELAERNFFGIDGVDINSLTFIDRANIFYKSLPGHFPLKFTPAEQRLIDRIGATESFDDVVALTDEIYGLSRSNRKIYTTPEGQPGGDDDDQGEEGQGKGQSDDDEGQSKGQSDDDEGQGTSGTSSKGAGANDNDDIIPECQTSDALEQALEKCVATDDVNYAYFDLPKVNHQNVVDDFTVVIPQMLASADFPYDNSKDVLMERFHQWRRDENETISFLVKEFETKKAADIQARTHISKTGVINTNKLHAYKYADDLFRRNATVTAGKNHGFVMFLDWSGSMVDHLNATMRQLFSLTMFCKRVGVPFEVYIFRSALNRDNIQEQFEHPDKGNYITYSNFKIRNVLSSRMNTTMLNSAYEILWCASAGIRSASDFLNGTPLNQTILAADKLVNDFQRRTRVQIVNTIIMTDGAGDGCRYNTVDHMPYKPKGTRQIVRDPITKMVYTRDYNADDTKVLLEVLRARTGTNLIGFFLSDSLNNISSTVVDYTTRKSRDFRKRWNEERYVPITTAGYDDYYLINIHGNDELHVGLKIDKTMTRSKIAKAYMNTRAKKIINRALLTRFIALIAKNKNKIA